MSTRRSGYLPSLDGWRAIAILAVIMDHDEPWTFHGHSNAAFHEYGGWGVFLFFAISGLLVCTRILEDESLLGSFQVRRFYIRRFFRIQPPAVVYLAVIALLSLLGIAHERARSLLGGLFLYQNYLFHAEDTTGRWFLTGHFWTLAVEEHFYLLLSLLLFWFRNRRLQIFAGVILLAYFLQRVEVHLRLVSPVNAARYTEWNIQYLFAPALVALLLRRQAFRDAVVKYLHPWVAFIGTAVLKQVYFLVFPLPPVVPRTVQNWILFPQVPLCYAFTVWVLSTMFHPHSWTTRLLETKPMRFIGRLSYSIYLWHALFIIGRLPRVGIHTRWLLVLTERPWRYIATLACAVCSYYLIEKPSIRLGHRLAPPATPGHADLANEQSPPQDAVSQSFAHVLT